VRSVTDLHSTLPAGARVLVLGSGGREHALAWRLARDPEPAEVLVAPGSAGMEGAFRRLATGELDAEGIAARCLEERVGLVVVGPEAPLTTGVTDALTARGILTYGPTRAAACLETSKWFAKDVMREASVPTARAEAFEDLATARAALEHFDPPYVVKADGLAAGKGVRVTNEREVAESFLADCLECGRFGAGGRRVLIEEFLEGEEASFFVFSDGAAVLPLAGAQDHKTVFDGDRGPNTGGMGAYSPTPVLDAATQEGVMADIVRPTIAAMAKDGTPYAGVLYVGLMITRDGPKVIEFNCRFGDPECQAILPRLDGDLLDLLEATATGRGLPGALRWSPRASVCVVMSSGGYPGPYETGRPISGVAAAGGLADVTVFQAGTALAGGSLVTAGGRVLGVQALGDDVASAVSAAYAAVARISFDGAHFRRDIGHHALRRLGS
jgi:phosphoribosylamine--glycine ligase